MAVEDEELRAGGHGLCSLLRRDFGFLVFVGLLSFFRFVISFGVSFTGFGAVRLIGWGRECLPFCC